MAWKGFKIWRGKLPHWRADDVTYYATFRHRRELNSEERQGLLLALLRPDGQYWDLLALGVGPKVTELLFRVRDDSDGTPKELSTILEPAKRSAGRKIMKKTGEKWLPFYEESFDRIVRDDTELETLIEALVNRQTEEDEDRLYLAPTS